MDRNQEILAQTMALLMSTTPETTLGKLLNFCLAAKVEVDISHKTALEFANELLEDPSHLSAWMNEVMESDGQITTDELIAVEEMHLKNPDKFMQMLLQELETLSL